MTNRPTYNCTCKECVKLRRYFAILKTLPKEDSDFLTEFALNYLSESDKLNWYQSRVDKSWPDKKSWLYTHAEFVKASKETVELP